MRLCDVSFHDGDGRSRSGWWAKADLASARIDMGAPTSVPGTVDARARDVGFLIDLFGSGRGYPRWMDRLVDSGEAHARGRVYWRADTLVLDAVHAGNDRTKSWRPLTVGRRRSPRPAFARSGMPSAGVDLQNGQRDLHLIRARDWVDAQPPLPR